jgi:hypothetical protein
LEPQPELNTNNTSLIGVAGSAAKPAILLLLADIAGVQCQSKGNPARKLHERGKPIEDIKPRTLLGKLLTCAAECSLALP